MKDLTDGSIAKNILQMALPIAAGMFFQTLVRREFRRHLTLAVATNYPAGRQPC